MPEIEKTRDNIVTKPIMHKITCDRINAQSDEYQCKDTRPTNECPNTVLELEATAAKCFHSLKIK